MQCIKTIFYFLFLSCNSLFTVPANSVIATINVGITPAGMAITPDSKFAYVANDNNYSITEQDSVSILDLSNFTLKKTIYHSSFDEPYTVTINSSGTKAYVTNSNSTTITIIDIKTNKVIGIIDGFDGPSGLAINSKKNIGYVNNYGAPAGVGSGNGKTVNIVDLNRNIIIGTIVVDQAPAGLVLSSDNKLLYVINYIDGNPGTGTMNVIRTVDNKIINTIQGFSGPFAISITPNGKFAYVTNFGSNDFDPIGTTVSVVDLKTDSIIKNIKLAIQPAGIDVTPDGRFVYASNYNTVYAGSNFTNLTAGRGTINIIDTKTNIVIPPIIAVDQSPRGVTISPDGLFAYVANYISNTVSVIALPTFEIHAKGCKLENIFLNQKDLINKIIWTARGTSLPVSYSIYRDEQLSDLAGIVNGQKQLIFFDHNIKPNVKYKYYIVGINKVGTRSEPVVVTID